MAVDTTKPEDSLFAIVYMCKRLPSLSLEEYLHHYHNVRQGVTQVADYYRSIFILLLRCLVSSSTYSFQCGARVFWGTASHCPSTIASRCTSTSRRSTTLRQLLPVLEQRCSRTLRPSCESFASVIG